MTHVILVFKKVRQQIGVVQLPTAAGTLRASERHNQIPLRLVVQKLLHVLRLQLVHLPR